MTKVITVFGATGNQGGSVVRAILNHPELSRSWKVRGITRDVTKANAVELTNQGVEMVKADLSDPNSLLQVLKGSNAVFGVTNYWERASLDYEVMQGKNLADASLAAGVEHLIWSTLPYVSKVTHGKLHNLHHFDSKAMVEEYIRTLPITASFVLPAYFMSNIPSSIQPSLAGDSYSVSWLFKPTTQIPMLDVPADFGKFVAACLLHPNKTHGKHIMAASGWFTPIDVVKAVEVCTGSKTEYREVPLGSFGGSKELLDNLLMIRDYEYYGPEAKEGVKFSHQLVGEGSFSTFEGFLKEIGV